MRARLQKIFIEYAPGCKRGVPDKVSAKAYVRVSLDDANLDVVQTITSGYATVVVDTARESRRRVEDEQLHHLKQILQIFNIPTIRFTDLAENAEGRIQ